MGSDYPFPLNNSGVLCLILLLFASLLLVRRFDVPYGVGVSRLFSAAKTSSVSVNGGLADENGDKMTRNHGVELELQTEERDFELQFKAAAHDEKEGASNSTPAEIEKSNHSVASTPGDLGREERIPSPPSSVSNKTAGDENGVPGGKNRIHLGSSGENISGDAAEETQWRKGSVLSIREIHGMFLRHTSNLPKFKKQWNRASDQQLINVRAQIEEATTGNKDNDGLYAPLYWNISRFRRSYEMMEQMLKIYIYKEGENPVFHQPRLTGIYASEGWFMKLLQESKQYVTRNPFEAHLFYLPFSSQMLEEALYVPNSHSFDNLKQYLRNYLNTIKERHSFWNTTSGADHFLVACHDWAPEETKVMMANCIRALCNADMGEGFQLGKDASLPETYVHSSQLPSRPSLGGKRASQRRILAFFAGKMHGYVRPILLEQWENKDPDMKIVGRMRKDGYIQHMKSSKYCICARGFEVNSPRLVEAIMYGCVPVIISDNFVPPFLEVLNWEKFSVFVLEKDIPNLKKVLLSISTRRYYVMQQRVKQVRRHFLWHYLPLKYDIFHMILHSVWFNRVFQIK